jgi:hypothetical protein
MTAVGDRERRTRSAKSSGAWSFGALIGVRKLLAIAASLWVIGFEEHLELDAGGVLECQYGTVSRSAIGK